MNFSNYPFSGTTFFSDVRKKMNVDRGLFAGTDGPLKYVVMDAIFHRFEVYQRPVTRTFAGGAEDIESLFPSFRVIINAQHCDSYRFLPSPGPANWQGEIIVDHNVIEGTPGSYPKHRFFGQWDGVGEGSYWVQKGNPSEISSPTTLKNAIGRLIPLVSNGVRFGPKAILDSNNRLVEKASSAIATWMKEPDGTGKSIVGVHRDTQAVFVLVQEHNYAIGGGLPITDVIARLEEMGVDDAVMGDGSTSVSLIADGVSSIYPDVLYKNNSITTGFAFRRQGFALQPGARLMRNNIQTTHPLFPPGFVSVGFGAIIRQWFGGLRLQIGSFGSIGARTSQDIANDLGVSLPLTLDSAASRFDVQVVFGSSNQKAELALVDTTPSMPGRIVGALKIYTSQGDAVFDIDGTVDAYNDD